MPANDNEVLLPSISLLLSASHSTPVTIMVDHNMTVTELSLLEPGSTYQVAVAGMNQIGTGPASFYETVMTMVPEGEPSPDYNYVSAHVSRTVLK